MVRLKEQKIDSVYVYNYKFQFLMVRLKAFWVAEIVGIHQFQFLMVRLKEAVYHIAYMLLDYFNSLWCD